MKNLLFAICLLLMLIAFTESINIYVKFIVGIISALMASKGFANEN
jgi:hypothetical protein